MKDFSTWSVLKTSINQNIERPIFKEREIWWVSIGANIGDEEDGKGDKFLRPVLVIRKFNKNLFLGVPLTKQVKENLFYFKLEVKDKIVCAMISQLRLFDSKRLLNRLEKLPEKEFEKVKREIVGKVLNFEIS